MWYHPSLIKPYKTTRLIYLATMYVPTVLALPCMDIFLYYVKTVVRHSTCGLDIIYFLMGGGVSRTTWQRGSLMVQANNGPQRTTPCIHLLEFFVLLAGPWLPCDSQKKKKGGQATRSIARIVHCEKIEH